MKCLSALYLICLIIAATFSGGQSVLRYQIILRYSPSGDISGYRPFCLMGMVATRHALGLAKCFVEKKIEDIQIYSSYYNANGEPDSFKGITRLKVDNEHPSDSIFALATIKKDMRFLDDEINPSTFLTRNDIRNFNMETNFILKALDEKYTTIENTPAKYLWNNDYYMTVKVTATNLAEPNWAGSPLYKKEHIAAVCEKHEKSDSGETTVFCRITKDVYQTLISPALNEEKNIAEKGKDEGSSSATSDQSNQKIC